MKHSDHDHAWARLTAGARLAPRATEAAAPYGFSTRVAALALAAERPMRSLLERFSPRAVGVASLLAVLSVVVNYSALTPTSVEDEAIILEDPVAVLLAQSD